MELTTPDFSKLSLEEVLDLLPKFIPNRDSKFSGKYLAIDVTSADEWVVSYFIEGQSDYPKRQVYQQIDVSLKEAAIKMYYFLAGIKKI